MDKGMIVAPQPEAVEAGALVLGRGGNAVDAAIACAFMQTVVDPQMAGIAGFGMMQVAMPGRGIHECLDFHARCPSAATPDMWAGLLEREAPDGFGFILKGRVNDVGYGSIASPASLLAWSEAMRDWGTMDWADIIRPAIERCRRGVTIRPHLHSRWTQNDAKLGRTNYDEKLRFTPDGRQIYFDAAGTLLRPGQILLNPDMARTLERIAVAGPEIFYTGEIAEEIDADMRANGGILRRSDLASYRTRRTPPLWTTYRDVRLAGPQPPGGGMVTFEILNILEEFDLTALGHNSPEHIRILAEAQKRAIVDRDHYLGDPEFELIPVERLLGHDHARAAAAAIRAGEQVQVVRAGAEPKETTTVHVIDRWGNAVSMTHTLGTPSGVITPGLGFMYNGSMGAFDPRPGRPGSIAPGKSRPSSMAPCIGFRGDTPFLSIGAPGGTHIPLSLSQVISNIVDFDMTILEAVCAPRISTTTGAIEVSNRIPEHVTEAVAAMGYPIARSHLSYAFAAVHGIVKDGDRLSGAADPQRDGMALRG